jgi:hypothetical protein
VPADHSVTIVTAPRARRAAMTCDQIIEYTLAELDRLSQLSGHT